MIVLITGQSGLDCDKVLDKFITKYPFQINEKPVYLKLEDCIDKIYRQEKSLSTTIKKKVVWKKFMREPYKSQENYWRKAFDSLQKKMDGIKNAQDDTSSSVFFINLHVCYFHRKTLEYLTIINVDLIKSLSPSKVITLIDDIYDVHQRLRREPDDIFYPDIPLSPTDVILEYLRVLDWRAKEIMMSRFIAKIIGCMNYVFAIKHNWDIFYNLIYDKHPTAYLSHPISEVRRLETKNNIQLANKIKNEITLLSDELRQHFAIFLPTTIDEFRIKKERKERNEIFYSVLSERWDSQLYQEPHNILYNHSEFNDINELWSKEKSDFLDQSFNSILKALNDSISAQVTTRDYILVEQSKYLIVYRPLFNGNLSGGVDKESAYHKDLNRVTELLGGGKDESSISFVYCPIDDIDLYRRNTFNYYIEDRIKKGVFICKDSLFTSITDDESNNLVAFKENKDDLIEFLRMTMHSHKIQITDDPEIKSKSPLKDNEEIIAKIYEELINEYLSNISAVSNFYIELAGSFPEHNIFDVKKLVNQILAKFKHE